ncbi:hypothetical protein [Streptomyces sp. KR55]|uniref:hypothetical protein n=1 Tax=Streptomyces sp. KR55 TaxID=3457425 RepID=UPI003FD3E749
MEMEKHTRGDAPASFEPAELGLLMAAWHRVELLIAGLETLPFSERTARIARAYLDEVEQVREAFDHFAQVDEVERQRLLLAWQQAAS